MSNSNKVGKFIVLVALFLLVFNSLQFNVIAEGKGIVSVSSSSGYRGDNVSIDIRLGDFPNLGVDGITEGSFDLNFDTTKLKVTKIEKGNVLGGAVVNHPGSSQGLKVDFKSGNIVGNGVLLRVSFELLESGSAELQLRNLVLKDMELNGVPSSKISVVNGSIQIKDDIQPPQDIEPSGISLNKTDINLSVGHSEKLSAVITPSDSSDKSVTWSSSNSSVAMVDNAGLVTAVGPGSATITVTTKVGGFKSTASVNVGSVIPTGIILDKVASSLFIGETEELFATISPSGVTNKEVLWSSSNVSIASVDASGVVTAIGPGSATISATTVAGNKQATARIHVYSGPIAITGVTITGSSTIGVNSLERLNVNFSPANASNREVTWKSSDTTVVTVSQSGVVRGIKEGEANVSVVTDDGDHKAEFVITVSGTEVNEAEPEDEEDIGEEYDNPQVDLDIFEENVIGNRLIETNNYFSFSTSVIYENKDLVFLDRGVKITISSELLKKTLEENNLINSEGFAVTITKVQQNIPDGFLALSPVYQFALEVDGVHIENFSGSVVKEFFYDKSKAIDLNRTSVFWYNEAESNWEKVNSSVDEQSGSFIARTNHWSKFVLLEDISMGASKGVVIFGRQIAINTLIGFSLLFVTFVFSTIVIVIGSRKSRVV